eukprot:TRINITY_DN10334_c0_g1_i1.p1 TRINITY_DN10334_c0_g1~~TRINITY_DN10334_c0_g1_i1.p1  ORF type:complete len:170 (-),score=62.35 TRINITY_DN10334_c0_g1_i1:253-762(-)
MDSGRLPCPHRILDDVGGAFAMGCIGGGVWHLFKGARNAPSGGRIVGAFQAARFRAPALGGNFAVWGGLYSSFDCTLSYLRKKEDPWNSIVAGGLTGGVLAGRSGFKIVAQNAVVGGVLLGLIEGLGILMNRVFSPQYQMGGLKQKGGVDLHAPQTLAPPTVHRNVNAL